MFLFISEMFFLFERQKRTLYLDFGAHSQKLRKATVSSVLSVCPPGHARRLDSHETDLYEI
jgi:hypothetical protein